jgi:hypothetical protein
MSRVRQPSGGSSRGSWPEPPWVAWSPRPCGTGRTPSRSPTLASSGDRSVTRCTIRWTIAFALDWSLDWGLQITIGVPLPSEAGIVDRTVVADASDDVLEDPSLRHMEEDVVGNDGPYPEPDCEIVEFVEP